VDILFLQNLLLMRKQLVVVVPIMGPLHIEGLMRLHNGDEAA